MTACKVGVWNGNVVRDEVMRNDVMCKRKRGAAWGTGGRGGGSATGDEPLSNAEDGLNPGARTGQALAQLSNVDAHAADLAVEVGASDEVEQLLGADEDALIFRRRQREGGSGIARTLRAKRFGSCLYQHST